MWPQWLKNMGEMPSEIGKLTHFYDQVYYNVRQINSLKLDVKQSMQLGSEVGHYRDFLFPI